MKLLAITFVILAALVIYSICLLVGGFILQWLWNWAVVGVFNAPYLAYWHAVGLVLILSFIGGFFKTSKK